MWCRTGTVGPPGRAADAGGLGDRVEADAVRLRLPPAGRLQVRPRGQRGQRLPAEQPAPLARWPAPPQGRSAGVAAVSRVRPWGGRRPGRYIPLAAVALPPM